LVLARAAYADNDLDEAIRHFKTSLSFDPYSKELHGYFAESSTKKLDKKIMELTRQVEKNAWKYSLRAELGKAFFYRGLLHEAISEFQVAVKDAALVSDVHKMQGLCYKELGRYDLAIQQFQKAIADLDQNNIPERLRLLLYIGLAYEAAGEQQKAVQIYEEIMTQDLNYEHIQTRIQKLNGFSWVEIRGKALSAVLADEEHKRLIPCWAKNSESDEFHKKHKNKNMDLSFSLEHNNNAVEHILKGRYTAATEELVLAEQLDPRFTIAYNNHAVLAMLEGNYDVAEGYLKKALELNPKLSVCSANLGVLAQVRGDKNAAKPYYEKALTLDTTAYTIHINYADVCYDQNDVQKAIVNWNKVLDVGILPELAKRRLKYRQP
jgi:tetratricopeptide (TPR) repeat protein